MSWSSSQKTLLVILLLVVLALGAYSSWTISSLTFTINTMQGTLDDLGSMLGNYTQRLEGYLTIAGSTTVLPISQACANLFMQENPGVVISITGGGSGHGISAISAGYINIGMSSKNLTIEQITDPDPDLQPVNIALDSVAIIVHSSNDWVDDLTFEEVEMIFNGTITDWNYFGGTGEIHVYTREAGSGTLECFENFFMENSDITGAAGEMRAAVSEDTAGIAFLSVGYIDETIKAVSIEGVEPTIDNLKTGDYTVKRWLFLITKGAPTTLEQAFIDFVLDEEGQEIVVQEGYLKLEWFQ
jgi:phosphate transport system substrate-binding protein